MKLHELDHTTGAAMEYCEFRVLGTTGHSSGYRMKMNPFTHMSCYKVSFSYLDTGPYVMGVTDHDKKGLKSSSSARVYITVEGANPATVAHSCRTVMEKFA